MATDESGLTDNGQRRCRAKAKGSGERCKKAAIPGGRVCRYHGGAAPQVQRKARLRLAELVDPAIATLGKIMVDQNQNASDRIRASENVLDRAGYPRSANIEVDDARDLLRQRLDQLREDRERRFGDDDE